MLKLTCWYLFCDRSIMMTCLKQKKCLAISWTCGVWLRFQGFTGDPVCRPPRVLNAYPKCQSGSYGGLCAWQRHRFAVGFRCSWDDITRSGARKPTRSQRCNTVKTIVSLRATTLHGPDVFYFYIMFLELCMKACVFLFTTMCINVTSPNLDRPTPTTRIFCVAISSPTDK